MTISSFRGDHAFLSNFYVHPLKIGKRVYTCGEQYFQSRKCVYVEDYWEIMSATYPAQHKKIGRRVELREDWEAIKIPVMRKLLRYKFDSPNSGLGVRLVSTGHHDLIEGNDWGDDYWGMVRGNIMDDGNNDLRGENWLGHLLMARREELRAMLIIAVVGTEHDEICELIRFKSAQCRCALRRSKRRQGTR